MKTKKNDIVKFVVLGVIIIWVVIFFIDYFRARNAQMPIICFGKETKVYEDGKVESCYGLGYKMYKYERASIPTSVEFGPFFIKERTK